MRGSAVIAWVLLAAALAALGGAGPWTAGVPVVRPPAASRATPSPAAWPAPVEALSSGARRLAVPDFGAVTPTAIVLHSTSGHSFLRALFEMERRGTGVHLLVDEDGTAYRLVPPDRRLRCAAGIDDVAVHVSVVGKVGDELVANAKALESTAAIVKALAEAWSIPLTNHDVASRRGVFSHMQAKFRFGGWGRKEQKDRMEPGESWVRAVLEKAGGAFHEEKDWKDRAGPGWTQVWEKTDLGVRGDLAVGRGLTPAPAPALKSVEVVEERRLQYVDRGRIEILGVVLHFTATETIDQAITTFEQRRLGPTIIVDVDGRAYQCTDRLEDQVAAAAGTNEKCVQIEIVGRGENDLLRNEAQSAKVVEVVRELCAKFSIPPTNRDVESCRGVFSHGQAKKLWGRSAWLWGGMTGDFDPGERYMRRVLEAAGGSYVEEKDWPGRTSGRWTILFDDWVP